MSLVYVGILSHAPGITGRAHLATNELVRDQFYDCLRRQAEEIKQSSAEVLIVIAAEHFANFFMDNMPAYCMGVGDKHSGPIEDSEWLKIDKTSIPGSPVVAHKILKSVMQSVYLAYSEEWQCDHGTMVP